ncbi:MAG: radical SAM family heme chaperone HemW [Bacteroidales bacterium]|nr:radical SAM family heme chaperone HemW [Clostridium sp.]MCM1202573.1 radical SAM family heme chaperone HemW [Bacteroidales bacterium]
MDKTKPEKRNLSLYIHIPFCKSKCSYCDFLSFGGVDYRRQKQYVAALCNEMEAHAAELGEYILRTVFIGGGTPSYLEASLTERIMQTVYRVFAVDEMAEITIEGNPDSLTADKLYLYRRLGINRLSIGLQSANDEILLALGRVHNYDQFIAAYNSARQAGFNNINIDIMSGLPGESRESYIRTLGKVADLQPEHISAYSLIVEEGTPLSRNAELLALLPSEEEDRLLYRRTKALLTNSGYRRYEISNYAKEGFACRHNLGYWTGREYLGIGLGASSYLAAEPGKGKLRFHGTERMENYLDCFTPGESLPETDREWGSCGTADGGYMAFIEGRYEEIQRLSPSEEMEEFMFLGLRVRQGISKSEFRWKFGAEVEEIYGQVLEKYKKLGLLLEEQDRIYLSEEGIDVSNVVMADFLL